MEIWRDAWTAAAARHGRGDAAPDAPRREEPRREEPRGAGGDEAGGDGARGDGAAERAERRAANAR